MSSARKYNHLLSQREVKDDAHHDKVLIKAYVKKIQTLIDKDQETQVKAAKIIEYLISSPPKRK